MKQKLTLLSILTFLFFHSQIQAQHHLDKAAMIYKYKSTKALKAEDKKGYEAYLVKLDEETNTCETQKCEMTLYFKRASIYHVLDYPADSIQYYLEKIFQMDSVGTCGRLRFFDKSHSEIPWKEDVIYFARDFSPTWWDQAEKNCQSIWDSLDTVKKPITKKDTSYSNVSYYQTLKAMKVNDQLYRDTLQKDGNNQTIWKKQRPLDLENRIKLDSLFETYGFPNKEQVGHEGMFTTWLIIQHSIDCDWNEKWIDRYMEYYVNGQVKGEGLYPNTISRFFHPKNGYCQVEDRIRFIKYLKGKYSKEVVATFGVTEY